MSFEKVELPAMITKLCCESGKVTVRYSTEVKEDGVSILVNSEEKEMVLEGMDDCLAKIAEAIAKA